MNMLVIVVETCSNVVTACHLHDKEKVSRSYHLEILVAH